MGGLAPFEHSSHGLLTLENPLNAYFLSLSSRGEGKKGD
jgi:hypothetical protein